MNIYNKNCVCVYCFSLSTYVKFFVTFEILIHCLLTHADVNKNYVKQFKLLAIFYLFGRCFFSIGKSIEKRDIYILIF